MRISRETRGYAEEAYDKLIGSGENSFQGMLDILTSDDYKEEAAQNSDEFKGARECASGILADLSRHAGEKKHIVGNLISEIDVVSNKSVGCGEIASFYCHKIPISFSFPNFLKFTGQIQADHVLVGEVVAKFNGTKETPGFCSILNTEVEELRKNAMEAAKTAQREHELAVSPPTDDDKKNNNRLNGTCLILVSIFPDSSQTGTRRPQRHFDVGAQDTRASCRAFYSWKELLFPQRS